jgi:hypothetical protein
MSEVEFDLLLDAVQTAIAPDFDFGEEFVAQSLPLRQPLPRAANDNDRKGWPLIPFPDGWHAAS